MSDEELFYFMRKNSVNLLRYLPNFLAKAPTFKNLEDALSWEHEQYRLKLVDIAKQFFLETCDENGLKDWEDFLGISPEPNQSFELRKAVARVKLRGCATMTVENTRKLMREFMTEGEPLVEELGDFEIRVGLDNGVYNWKEMFQALLEYLPAHLDFSIKFQDHRENDIYIGHSEVYAGEEIVSNATLNKDYQNIYLNTALQDVIHDEVLNDDSAIDRNENSLFVTNMLLEVEHEEILAYTPPEPEYDSDFEKLLWERWRYWRNNPVVRHYCHHFDDEGEIDPDDPNPDEPFPLDRDFLRLYFEFPKNRVRWLTVYNPRSDLVGRDINAVGYYAAANKTLLNSYGDATTGIKRALIISKSIDNILGGHPPKDDNGRFHTKGKAQW